jgi:hypothetical protein
MPDITGEPIDVATLDGSVVAEGIAKLSRRPRLQGVCLPGNPPILFFHLPDKLAKLQKRGSECQTKYLPDPYCGVFGASLGIVVSFNNWEALTTCSFSNTEPSFRLLALGRFIALFINSGRPIFAHEVSLNKSNESLLTQWEQAAHYTPKPVDPYAFVWLSLSSLADSFKERPEIIERNLTKGERLSIG